MNPEDDNATTPASRRIGLLLMLISACAVLTAIAGTIKLIFGGG